MKLSNHYMKFSILFFFILVINLIHGQTDILSTDFQTGIPIDYTMVDNDGFTPAAAVSEYTSAWIIKQDPTNTLDSVASSTSFFEPTGTASRWLITPPLVLGAYGNYIEWEAKSHDASFPDSYLVLVSTTDDQIASFTDTVGYVIEENFEWTNRSVNFSTYGYVNQTIYLAFVNVTNNGFKLYLDDIHAWIEDPVGINEIENNVVLSVFPNPTTGIIQLKSETNILSTEIYSTDNQLVLVSKEKTIDLNQQTPGIYFLRITTEKGQLTKRVTIL